MTQAHLFKLGSCVALCLSFACSSGGDSMPDDGTPSDDAGVMGDAGRQADDGGMRGDAGTPDMDAAMEPAPDGGMEDAGMTGFTAKHCTGTIDAAGVDQAACERIIAVFGQCSGEKVECLKALDEPDCKARNCTWYDEPRCNGIGAPIACSDATSTGACEMLPGCSVALAQGRCEGDGVDCGSFDLFDCDTAPNCELASDGFTCIGKGVTCAELSLSECRTIEWDSGLPGVTCYTSWDSNDDIRAFGEDDCTFDADCASDEYCRSDGECMAKQAVGTHCGAANECSSERCEIPYDPVAGYPVPTVTDPDFIDYYSSLLLECVPAADCSLDGCDYCRVIDNMPRCMDVCDEDTKPCTTCGCPQGEEVFCDSASDACIPKLGATAACDDDSQCASGRCGVPASSVTSDTVCLVKGGRSCNQNNCDECIDGVCLGECSADTDCSNGYRCVDVDVGARCAKTCSGSGGQDVCDAGVGGTCRGKALHGAQDDFVLVCDVW